MIDMKKLRVPDYIQHIIEAIIRIEVYIAGLDCTSFTENSLVHDAVVRNFEIIGEAANKIKTVDVAFAQQHPTLALDEAYQMRNALAHGYYTVNLMTVWNAVHNDLPVLKQQMLDIQKALPVTNDRGEPREIHGIAPGASRRRH